MQVILLEKVARLGAIGDTVTVKDGFARNYLIPQGKALRASKENTAKFEAQRAEIEKRNAASRSEAEKLAKKLEKVKIELVRAASEEGKLYGSVTVRDIGQALEAQGFNIPRQNLVLSTNIRTIGQYEVRVMPHPEIELKLPVRIARNESEFSIMDESKEETTAADEAAA